MIEGFEYTGRWWLPDKPDDAFSGRLKYTYKTGAVLELQGSFESLRDRFNNTKPLIIIGTSSDGKDISLHYCSLFSGQRASQGFETCLYLADIVFVGAHFFNEDAVRFVNMSIRYSYLDEWVDIPCFSSTHSEEGDLIVKYLKPDDICAKIDNGSSIIVTQIVHMRFARIQKDPGIKTKWIVKIATENEASLEDYRAIIQHLQSFLCLAVREPVHVLGLEGENPVDMNDHASVKIFYKSPFIVQPSGLSLILQPLFTYQDISADFEVMLRNWFDKEDSLKPICDLYFRILQNPYLYLENQFLSLVQAVEAFHRRVFKGRNALRKRLGESLDECGKIVPQLLGNREYFIDKTVESRNYYTHYDKDLYERAARGQELVKIARKLKVLLEVCLITQTGLDEKKSGDLFSKIRGVREDAFGSIQLKRKSIRKSSKQETN